MLVWQVLTPSTEIRRCPCVAVPRVRSVAHMSGHRDSRDVRPTCYLIADFSPNAAWTTLFVYLATKASIAWSRELLGDRNLSRTHRLIMVAQVEEIIVVVGRLCS